AAEPRRVAGAVIGVDILLAEAGILQRAQRHLGVELRQRLVLGLACGMLVDPGDIRLALDAHVAPTSGYSAIVDVGGQRRRRARPLTSPDLRTRRGAGVLSARGRSDCPSSRRERRSAGSHPSRASGERRSWL